MKREFMIAVAVGLALLVLVQMNRYEVVPPHFDTPPGFPGQFPIMVDHLTGRTWLLLDPLRMGWTRIPLHPMTAQ